MHSAFLLLVITITCALAAPTAPSHGRLMKRSFKVPRQGRPRPSVQEAVRQVHRKYGSASTVWGGESSDDQSLAAPSNSSTGGGSEEGEVQAIPDTTHGAYISPVDIGGQKLYENS